MCGICGIITRHHEVDVNVVQRMNHVLSHRGPDGDGKFNASHLAIAMRRLSIIDLNSGWQPLYNEDRSIAIIANGEIYNYIELRDELQKRGHHLSTKSDIETIAHLYEEYGLGCVNHLRGMFAFALWDEKRKRLVLARDRMGEKPLYLYETNDTIYFASELKALLQSKKISIEFDPESIHYYFHYGYVPEPRTPLRGIRKLPAGHLLVVDVEPWSVTEQMYWRIEDIPPFEGDPVKMIREELERTCELVIRSDVPVGVALSGGVDSSAIAVLASHKYPGVMQAFSVGYPGRPNHDEREMARQLAKQLKMPFHEVELSTQEQTDFFEDLVYWQDDPIADISGFGYYALSRKAREMGVPVLLQGQGGDELFWGYEWVRQAALQTARKQSMRSKGWRGLPSYLQIKPPEGWRPQKLLRWIHYGFGVSGWQDWQRDQNSPFDQMVMFDTIADFSAAKSISKSYTDSFRAQLMNADPASIFTHTQPWPNIDTEITRLISSTYLLENGIAQGDRLSMSNSVELRLPFVDYRLVETVIGLRLTSSDVHLPAKFWLKQALVDVLPTELLNRPKQGFQPPTVEWHRNLFGRYGDLLEGGALQNMAILSPKATAQFRTGEFPLGVVVPLSFKALVLEMWARKMM